MQMSYTKWTQQVVFTYLFIYIYVYVNNNKRKRGHELEERSWTWEGLEGNDWGGRVEWGSDVNTTHIRNFKKKIIKRKNLNEKDPMFAF